MIPVIIPAYGKKEQLEKCITHLKNQTVEVEIFVRDNTDDNIHFTAAVNEGIKKYLDKDFEYILILNQDMYLEPDAVEQMTKFMGSCPRCGIGTPLQLQSQNPDHVICGGSFQAFPFGKHSYGPISQFTEDCQIPWGNGACMMFRKQMIQEIGLLDANLVFLGSDSDYSFTARARGWQVWRIAAAKGVHEHGASGAINNPEIEKLKINDMLYFGNKWLTGGLYKSLSYEGKNCTPQAVESIMTQLQRVKNELQKTTANQPAP